MSGELDLSIVIVSYETRELVCACLRSLQRVRPALQLEVIVVDNASTDGTVDALRREFPEAQLLPLPRNVGFAAGCNQGLLKMRGRHALLLNSDTELLPGALEECVAYLDSHPDVGVVGPQLLNPDGSKQNCIHNAPTLVSELVGQSLLRRLFPQRYPSRHRDYSEPLEVEAVLGAALMVRADVVQRVGPLDEDFFFFLEETDWCCRIRAAGFKVVHLPSAELVHISGAASKQKAPLRTRIEYHRSRYTFFAKHYGALGNALLKGIVLTKTALGCLVGGKRAADYRALLRWHWNGRQYDARIANNTATADDR